MSLHKDRVEVDYKQQHISCKVPNGKANRMYALHNLIFYCM